MKINLFDVIEALELSGDEFEHYYNRMTREVIVYSDSLSTGIDQSDFVEELENDDEGKYIELPSRYQVNEYVIMEAFVLSLKDENIRVDLSNAIQGKGAFRRFKDRIFKHDLTDDWHFYRDNQYKQVAIRWCKDHGIDYQ